MRVSFMTGLVVTLTLLQLGSAAQARGFCNVDHFPEDEEVRGEVAQAAADFYDGLAGVMTMLRHFELGEIDALEEAAGEAEFMLMASARRYESVAISFEQMPFPSITETAFGEIQAMALAGEYAGEAPVDFEVIQAGPEFLLAGCGQHAETIAVVTAKFLQETIEEPRSESFSRVLGELEQAFHYGRIVSASFAHAGGERPE